MVKLALSPLTFSQTKEEYGTGTNFVISLVNDGSKQRTEIQELI